MLIYALGHVSGAHFNPGVTLSFAVFRHFQPRDVLPYWAAQFAGATLGAAILLALFGNVNHLGATFPSGSDAQSFGMEIVLTFVLMFVITAVATDTRAVGQAAAIAIGAASRAGHPHRRADLGRFDEPGPQLRASGRIR